MEFLIRLPKIMFAISEFFRNVIPAVIMFGVYLMLLGAFR